MLSDMKFLVRKDRGFTLIELVMTLLILTIVSVFAVSKFTNLRQEANVSKLKAMEGALNTAMSHWYAYAKLKGCSGGGGFLTKPDGTSLYFLACYPEAGDAIGTNEIDTLLNSDGFTISLSADTEYTYFDVTEAANPATCRAAYRQGEDRGGINRPASVTVTKTGC